MIGGFNSGIIRLFQISTLKIIHEKNYHRYWIECLSVSHNNKFLVSGDSQGVYSIINISNDYNLI